MRLEGKTVLLTGATGGLGRAMATALANRGATLVLSSRKAEELDELVATLPGAQHRAVVSDLAEDGAALRLLEDAGEIEVLVANAGLPASGRLDGFSQEEIGRALRVNLESPVRMARELLPGWQTARQRPLRLRLLDLGVRLDPACLALRGDQVRAARLCPQPA